MLVKYKKILAILIGGFALCASVSYASQMTYTPVNPDFGGSPFNGSTLLSEANANNHYVAPTPKSTTALDDLVTNSVLSSIAASISNKILNSHDGDSGSFTSGSSTITYRNVGGTITQTVYDNSTGQATVFTYPAGM